MSNPQRAHHSAQPDPRRWKALALLCTAFFMVILDSAIAALGLVAAGLLLGSRREPEAAAQAKPAIA
jgi:hypothetical protein